MPISKWLVAVAALLPLTAGAQAPAPQNPADPRAAAPAVPDASLFPRYRAAADMPGTPDAQWRQANREVAAPTDAMVGMRHDMPGMQHGPQQEMQQGVRQRVPQNSAMPDMPHRNRDAEGMTRPAHDAMPAMHGMHHAAPVAPASAGHPHAGGH